jgi:hypothetical protein
MSETPTPDASEEAATESLDDVGPVDFLIVAFPEGEAKFTGEALEELVDLVEDEIIRVINILILTKDDDGTISAANISDFDDLGPLETMEAELAELLAVEDLAVLAEVMDPGDVAGLLVYENLWSAPFASAVRRAGGQLIANGRIPIQAIAAAIAVDEEDSPGD